MLVYLFNVKGFSNGSGFPPPRAMRLPKHETPLLLLFLGVFKANAGAGLSHFAQFLRALSFSTATAGLDKTSAESGTGWVWEWRESIVGQLLELRRM